MVMAHAEIPTANVRLAMIGLGHVARPQLRALALSKGWTLAGAADTNPERHAILPDGVPRFDSADALLRQVEADLVLVATPTHTHYDVGRQVLSAGHNLLLEKPCCANDAEFEALEALAREHGGFFHVALHSLHARDLLWFLDHRAQILPDNPTSVHCRFFDPYVDDHGLRPEARALGGSWLDSGINALAVAAAVTGTAGLELLRASRGAAVEGADDLHATVRFASPEPASSQVTIETSWLRGINAKSTVVTCEASGIEVLLDHSGERVRITREGALEQIVELATDEPRLVNHYCGVLEDARLALADRRSNVDFARAIHRSLFMALQAGQQEEPWH